MGTKVKLVCGHTVAAITIVAGAAVCPICHIERLVAAAGETHLGSRGPTARLAELEADPKR